MEHCNKEFKRHVFYSVRTMCLELGVEELSDWYLYELFPFIEKLEEKINARFVQYDGTFIVFEKHGRTD